MAEEEQREEEFTAEERATVLDHVYARARVNMREAGDGMKKTTEQALEEVVSGMRKEYIEAMNEIAEILPEPWTQYKDGKTLPPLSLVRSALLDVNMIMANILKEAIAKGDTIFECLSLSTIQMIQKNLTNWLKN